MAYIRKRGSSWSYTIDIGADPVTGKRRQATKGGFNTKRAAELAAAKAETEVSGGTFVQEQNVSFRSFAENWLSYYRLGIISRRPKPAAVLQRGYQIDALLKYFDSIKVSAITRKQYQDALIDMSYNMARNTVQGIHSVGRMIFRRAVQDGVIKNDPTEFAKIPTPEETDELPKYMEKEELAQFLDLAKRRGLDNDYPIFLTLAYTGMRLGELCALKWSNINFTEMTVTIAGTLFNPNDMANQYEIVAPKTKSSKRTIDVDGTVIKELERLKAAQNEFKMQHRKTYHDADFVFGRIDKPYNSPPSYGFPPNRRTVERRMDRITRWMDIPKRLTPHSLRHTHASLLAEAGASLEAIQERLGHKDDHTTRLVYTHVTRTVKRQAAEKFSALMDTVVKM